MLTFLAKTWLLLDIMIGLSLLDGPSIFISEVTWLINVDIIWSESASTHIFGQGWILLWRIHSIIMVKILATSPISRILILTSHLSTCWILGIWPLSPFQRLLSYLRIRLLWSSNLGLHLFLLLLDLLGHLIIAFYLLWKLGRVDSKLFLVLLLQTICLFLQLVQWCQR